MATPRSIKLTWWDVDMAQNMFPSLTREDAILEYAKHKKGRLSVGHGTYTISAGPAANQMSQILGSHPNIPTVTTPVPAVKSMTASSFNTKAQNNPELRKVWLKRGRETADMMNSIWRCFQEFDEARATKIADGFVNAMEWDCTPSALFNLTKTSWSRIRSPRRKRGRVHEIPVVTCTDGIVKLDWTAVWEDERPTILGIDRSAALWNNALEQSIQQTKQQIAAKSLYGWNQQNAAQQGSLGMQTAPYYTTPTPEQEIKAMPLAYQKLTCVRAEAICASMQGDVVRAHSYGERVYEIEQEMRRAELYACPVDDRKKLSRPLATNREDW